jgi:hypothetical protein
MLDDRSVRAARNNAEWCDAVCRAHNNPGEFHDDIWISRHPVPRFYPNAGTLAEPNPRQLDLIDELIGVRLPPGWAVKDSFSMLDLESRGFRMLFDAEWIYLPVSRVKDVAARERQRDGKSCATISRWQNGNTRGADQVAIRAKIEFSCHRYSITEMWQWSLGSVIAISSQARLGIEAMASSDGRTFLLLRPGCLIMPQRR